MNLYRSWMQTSFARVAMTAMMLVFGGATSWATDTINFTTPGTYTWTCPAGITSIQVECWGGGGAGGAANGGASSTKAGGGGGGGGAYTINASVSVTPGTSYTITVGAGGTSTGASATGGNTTSINTAAPVSANGGAAGTSASGNGVFGAGGAGGTGGTYTGGSGALAVTSVGGGGGGSSAGTGANGNNGGVSPATATTGGATAPTGGGNGGNGSTSSGNGTAASSPGGGGGGAYSTTATQHNGGAGGAGKLVITLANNVSFTPGNLVVERVGDGIESFSSSGDTIYMDEFTTSGSYVQNFKITDSGSSALIDGSAGSDGGMTLSADGRFLCMPGYNINQPYSSSLANAMGSAVPRGVGTVSAAGSYSFVVSSATVDSGNNIRGAATDGNGNYWASGGASGVDYLGTANSAANVYSANLRCVNIINNNLWYDTGSTSPGIGIWKYSGKPTTAVGNTATEIITITNTASTASPYNFAVDAAEDTIYYADDGSGSSETTANAGIHKWRPLKKGI